MQDFILNDNISKKIQARKLHPRLLEGLEKKKRKLDLILLDLAWFYVEFHKS